MPAPFSLLDKFIMLLNLAPSPLFDLVGGFSFHAVHAAVKLDLFEKLGGDTRSPEDIARMLGCDTRGLEILLEVLVSLGYIVKTRRGYRNGRIAKKWMLSSSPVNYSHGFRYYAPTMTDLFPHIDKSVKKGNSFLNFYDWLGKHPEVVPDFQTFMMGLGKMSIPEITGSIRLKKETVLDIGGSHGLYSIGLCEAYEDISVSIIDSKYAMPLLKQNIASASMERRIRLITGDFLKYRFRESYDVVLLFNVLHEHTEEYNLAMITKIRNILNPGGRLVILDNISENKPTASINLVSRTYGLMFYHFLGGRNYRYDEMKKWLSSCGFKKTSRKKMLRSGFSLVTGRV